MCSQQEHIYRISHAIRYSTRGLGGLVVSAFDFQAGYREFESRSGRGNFQTISTHSSYSTFPGLSIKWTGRRLVTECGIKCAWKVHESKAVHNNRRCLYMPRVPGGIKSPHNNNNTTACIILCAIHKSKHKFYLMCAMHKRL